MPPTGHLANIRKALADDHETFGVLVRAPRFRRRFGALSQEAMLTRVPRGIAPDHPAANWLRYKSFTVRRVLSSEEVFHPDLPRRLARDIEAMLPLVRWLNQAIGYPPAVGRLA